MGDGEKRSAGYEVYTVFNPSLQCHPSLQWLVPRLRHSMYLHKNL
jgi:hypothetical protein